MNGFDALVGKAAQAEKADEKVEISEQTPAEKFSALSATIAEKRAALVEAPAEQLAALSIEISNLEDDRDELFDAAHEEATAEAATKERDRIAAQEAKSAEDAASLSDVRERLGLDTSTQEGGNEIAPNQEILTALMGVSTGNSQASLEMVARAKARLAESGIIEPRDPGRDNSFAWEYDDKLKFEMDTMFREALFQVRDMGVEQQAELARTVHNELIVKDFSGTNMNRALYIYNRLSGTPFADEFRKIESARLTAAGYPPLAA